MGAWSGAIDRDPPWYGINISVSCIIKSAFGSTFWLANESNQVTTTGSWPSQFTACSNICSSHRHSWTVHPSILCQSSYRWLGSCKFNSLLLYLHALETVEHNQHVDRFICWCNSSRHGLYRSDWRNNSWCHFNWINSLLVAISALQCTFLEFATRLRSSWLPNDECYKSWLVFANTIATCTFIDCRMYINVLLRFNLVVLSTGSSADKWLLIVPRIQIQNWSIGFVFTQTFSLLPHSFAVHNCSHDS